MTGCRRRATDRKIPGNVSPSGGGAVQLASLAGEFTQRGFAREQETQADRFGLALLVDEYAHASCAEAFLEHLSASSGLREDPLASYFSSHPLNTDRIEARRETALEMGWELQGELRALPALGSSR